MKSQFDTHSLVVASPAAFSPPELTPAQNFLGLITDALQTLQLMQEQRSLSNDAETDELLLAIANGGLSITAGDFDALVFKRCIRELACKRR
jgi:hypothetical protein